MGREHSGAAKPDRVAGQAQNGHHHTRMTRYSAGMRQRSLVLDR
jgi:hypothetical protein